MKKIVYLLIALLILVIIGITGCNHTPVPPGEETSSCVICHSDKEMLQQTATVEEQHASEETSGEG
jgi:hypothetical protein